MIFSASLLQAPISVTFDLGIITHIVEKSKNENLFDLVLTSEYMFDIIKNTNRCSQQMFDIIFKGERYERHL